MPRKSGSGAACQSRHPPRGGFDRKTSQPQRPNCVNIGYGKGSVNKPQGPGEGDSASASEREEREGTALFLTCLHLAIRHVATPRSLRTAPGGLVYHVLNRLEAWCETGDEGGFESSGATKRGRVE